MASHSSNADAVHDRAAHWVARLNDNDLSDAERADLHAWLLADPRHAREFRAHNAVISLAREFPPDIRARLDTLLPVTQVHTEASRKRWAWQAAAAAAALVAVVAVGWFMSQPPAPPPKVYTTKTGENRTVAFKDGSVAYLNTRSELQVPSGTSERRVMLRDGEVLFDVIHDPAHPFRVVLENSEIQVLGTRFNVYRRRNGDVTVTVLEGKIEVKGSGHPGWERDLAASQSITYNDARVTEDVHGTVGTNATAWRDGKLELKNEPLAGMVSELSRYTDKRIDIRDKSVEQIHVGGAFTVKDVGVALRYLEEIAQVRVDENNGGYTINLRTNNEDKRNN